MEESDVEITETLIHTGSELIHSGPEQFLYGFGHVFDLEKADLEKEAFLQ